MYDGPNYNPYDVQRHAPGQPPWVQAQAKATHDAAAWQAYQKQKNGCHRIGDPYSAPNPQPPTPLLQSQGFRVYCTIIVLFFGSATLGALAYGAPVMAIAWGFLLVSLIGLPFIVAALRRQWA